jgi:hypothetical protein
LDPAFERIAASVCYPDADGLELQTAQPEAFGTRGREPLAHKVEQFGREPCKEQRISAAARP